MKLRPLFLTLLALCAVAVPAWAATDLLSDDAEGEITAKWVVDEPTHASIQPWQKGDSTTPKVPRPTTTHGGSGSYWSGVSPQDNNPAPDAVIEGSSTMHTKEPIVIPADGKTTFSMWSFFQNEGDDLGEVDVALATSGTAPAVKDKAWKKLTEYKLAPSAAGDSGVVGYCNPSDPVGTAQQTFEEVKGDFAAYAGKKVWVRIHLKYGGENRSATQACDWYVDDIKIETTGTPGNASDAASPTVAEPTPATPAKSTVKFAAFKAKGKAATVKLKITNGPVRNAVVTLLKGKKKLAAAKVAVFDSGVAPVKLKLKKKLAKGTYVLKFKGTGGNGAAVTASGKGKVR
jgi:hypothetical protein